MIEGYHRIKPGENDIMHIKIREYRVEDAESASVWKIFLYKKIESGYVSLYNSNRLAMIKAAI